MRRVLLCLAIALGFVTVGESAGVFLFRASFVADTTPDAFNFVDQTSVAVSSTITSAAITVSGINASTAISVSGGTYDINSSGSFTSSGGSVVNGDTVRARHTSSASNSTAVNTVVTIGGVSDTFTSTTTSGGSDILSDPVTTALNASCSGTRYDVNTDSDLNSVPFGALTPGSVVNIFWKASAYTKKFGIRTKDSTQSCPVIINGVTDASGNRPAINCQSATSAAGSNPSGGYAGANDVFSAGTELLGCIIVKRGPAGTYASDQPKWFEINNLEVYGTRGSYSFTAIDGSTKTYNGGSGTGGFAAGIWINLGQDFKLQNNVLHDNDLGIFTQAKDDILAEACQRAYIANNRVYSNGINGADGKHNFYIQCANPLVEGNYMGQTFTGSTGSTYKDRSSGLIFRYNWVEASARALDLVHSEEQNTDGIMKQADYGTDFVYGNVIANDCNLTNGCAAASVHYGGDNQGEEDGGTAGSADVVPGGSAIYRSHLYFWNNTYVLRATLAQSYRTQLFQPSLVGTTIDCWNNTIVMNGTSQFRWVRFAGNLNLRGNNIAYGTIYADADDGATNPAKYEVTQYTAVINSDPLLTSISTLDYSLGSGSSALDLTTLPSGMPSTFTTATGTYSTTVNRQPRFRSNGMITRTVLGTAFDLGALERGIP